MLLALAAVGKGVLANGVEFETMGAAGGDAEHALHHPFPLFAVRRHAAEVFPHQQVRQFMRDDLIDKGLLVFQ